ncbi:MAG TPA: hypothetical protein VN522_11740 [Solirubrobacterales bacterium]|nr:hypothetical protein [Solirubrobacterales bacterium]
MKPDSRHSIVPSICAALLVIAAALWLVPSAFAKPGAPDPGFGSKGKTITQNVNVKQKLWAYTDVQVARGGNGMIYVLARYNGQEASVIAFDPDGAVDKSFGSNGRLVLPRLAGGGGVEVEAIAADASGRLIVAGQEASVTPGRPVVAWRFLPTGVPDTSFGSSGSGYATATVPYSAEGVFGQPALPFVRGVAVAPTGQVVLSVAALYGGTFSGGSFSSASVVRFTEGGALDPTFGHGGIFLFGGQGQLADTTAPVIGPDGSIEVAGESSTCQVPASSDPPIVGHLARLTPSGQLDTTFGNGAFVEVPKTPISLAIDAAGRTVTSESEGPIRRYTSAGAIDTSFGKKRRRTDLGGQGGGTGRGDRRWLGPRPRRLRTRTLHRDRGTGPGLRPGRDRDPHGRQGGQGGCSLAPRRRSGPCAGRQPGHQPEQAESRRRDRVVRLRPRALTASLAVLPCCEPRPERAALFTR